MVISTFFASKKYWPVGTKLSPPEIMADAIREGKKDFFVFIITNEQQEQWDEWITTQKLNDLIIYEMPNYVSNCNYPDMGRRLKLYVLSGGGEAMKACLTSTQEEV